MAKSKISISISEKQLNYYRNIAEQQNKPVAHVIVDQLQKAGLRPTTQELFAAVNEVQRKYKGFLSREQAMHITSVALNCLHDQVQQRHDVA